MPVLVSIMATFTWLLLGLRFGLDGALDESDPSPAYPTLVVLYLPLAGGALLIVSAVARARRRVISERRSLLGVAACVVIWAVCLAIVLAS